MIISTTLLVNMFYLTSRILLLVTHFIDLSARMYQLYSLRMALLGLKNVGVTRSVNNTVVF